MPEPGGISAVRLRSIEALQGPVANFCVHRLGINLVSCVWNSIVSYREPCTRPTWLRVLLNQPARLRDGCRFVLKAFPCLGSRIFLSASNGKKGTLKRCTFATMRRATRVELNSSSVVGAWWVQAVMCAGPTHLVACATSWPVFANGLQMHGHIRLTYVLGVTSGRCVVHDSYFQCSLKLLPACVGCPPEPSDSARLPPLLPPHPC